MKKCNAVMIAVIFCLLIQISVHAQQSSAAIKIKSIEPYKIAVSYTKTSNLIFPFTIKSVDRGSAAILVQKAKGVENILQVKAAEPGFTATNLSVVTGDGQFYSFIIDYGSEPSPLNMSFTKDTTDAFLSDTPLNEAELKGLADQVQLQHSFLHKRVREQEMKLSLQGIYLSPKTMWFKLKLSNHSLIDYTPDYIRFLIRDGKHAKRTAVQENKLLPVYLQPSFVVNGNAATDIIYGFAPFTIPASRELIMEVAEENGGRTLRLHISHRAILKARLLEN